MNKAIYIGELTLNVSLSPDGNASTRVGDRAVAAAMLDAEMGVETMFVGEASADTVGDHIVGTLDRSHVDTSSVDRFTEGASPVKIASVATPDGEHRAVLHAAYPTEPVNPVWPRINEGDVTVYGSYMAIDKRNHKSVIDIISHARARKAHTVYLPYFDRHLVPRITRIMPEVWECFEQASLIIATVDDIATLFPGESPADAFRAHMLFYCRRCLVLDYANLTMHFFDGDDSWTLKCHPTADDCFHWTSSAIAGAVRTLTEGITDPDSIMAKANETAHSRLSEKI